MRTQRQANGSNISIFLRLHNGNGCSMQVSKFITLAQLKEQISEGQIQTPNQYQFVFQGRRRVKLDQALCNIGVGEGSIIHIDDCSNVSPNKLKLDVGFFYNGEKIVIRASRNETILELKTKIYRLIGVLPRHQIIIFRGSKLDDQQTLAYYHIAEDSLVCLHTNAVTEQVKTFAMPFKQNRELISATTSVSLSKEAVKRNKGNMFRSQSLGAQKQPFQVQIQQENRSELSDSKQFQFQLLTPMPFLAQLQQNISNQQNLSSSSQMDFKILLNRRELHQIKLPMA